MPSTHRWTLAVSATGWLLLAVVAPAEQAGSTAQRPTFRSGVELITIDATVVDASGQPVPGLAADDFEVSVDGRPRRVVSAQFIDLSGTTPRRGPGGDNQARLAFSSNESEAGSVLPPPDRFIILAVDHSSFLPGTGRQTLEAARRFVASLDDSDRVALASFPDPSLFIPPTTDRGAILRALGRIAGTAERIESPHMELSIGLTEALDIAGGDRTAFERVASRECLQGAAPADIEQCRAVIELDVPMMVAELRARTSRSLVGLQGVLENLSEMGGRKTVVLVSAGLASSPEHSALDLTAEMALASRAAARANAVVHALHADTSFLDAYGADRRRRPASVQRDMQLFAAGLETVVDLNGGALFRVPASADAAFGRIAREISAFYVLGVEAAPGDRDGRPHAIRVRIPGRRATVRHRQLFTIARPSAADASPEEDLAAVLRSGQILREVPVRLSTQVMRDLRGENVRVLVRADIGSDVAVPTHLRVALALFDEAGQPAGSTTSFRPFEPTHGPDAAWPYQEMLTVRPGIYTLRFAAKDADGRIGTVAHRFDASLRAGQGVRLSDLLVADPDRAAATQPATLVDGRARGPRLSTYVEVYPEHGTPVSAVSFEIVDRDGGTAVVSAQGTVTDRSQDQRAVARAELDLRAVAAGQYLVRATAYSGNAIVGRVTRPLTIVGSPGAGPATPAPDDAPGTLAPAPPRFDRAAVLRGDVVAYFLRRLESEDPAGMTPPVRAAAAAAARGEYAEVLRVLADAGSSTVAVPFLRGLALFATNHVEPAAVELRASLRAARGFLPAAFYLGACEAATGRDEQAIAAWQAALISESGARVVYEVLADAWLRLGNGLEALHVVSRARARWPDDDGFTRREAAARALMK